MAKPVRLPDLKISETLLDFGKPWLDLIGPVPAERDFKKAMEVIVTIWNAVPLDAQAGRNYVDQLRARMGTTLENGPGAALMLGIAEQLIRRRPVQFADDPRVVKSFEIRVVNGEPRLRVEACLAPGVEAERGSA